MAYNFKRNANGTFGVINNKLNNLNPLQLSVQPKQSAPKLSVATPTKINNSLPVQFTAPKTNTLSLQDNRPFPMRVPGSSPVSATTLPRPVVPTTSQVLSKAVSDGFGWIPKTAEGIGNSVLSTAKLVPDVALLGTSKLIGDDKSYKEASKLFNNNLKNSIPGGAVSLLQKAGNEIAGISYAASKIPEAIKLSNQIKSAQKSGDKVKEQFYRDQYKKFNEASGQEVFDYYNNISPTVTGDVGSYNTPDSIEKGDSITPAIKGVAEIAPWMIGGSSSRVTNALVQGAVGGTTNAAMQLANGQPFDFNQLGQAVAAPAAFGALMPSKGNKSTIVKQADEAHINMANALDNATDPTTRQSIVQDMIATQRAKALANSPELLTGQTRQPNAEVLAINQHIADLNAQRSKLVDQGLSENSAALINNNKAYNDAVLQRGQISNDQTNIRQFTQKPDQRGSLNVGRIADDLNGKNKTKVTAGITDPLDTLRQEAKKYKTADEFIYNNGLEHPEYKRRVAENQKFIDENRKVKNLEDNLPYPNPDKGINREADLTALYNQANGITGKLGKENDIYKQNRLDTTTQTDQFRKGANMVVDTPAPQVTKTDPNRNWKLSNQVGEGNRMFTDAQHAVSKKMDEFRTANNGKPFTDAQKKELNVYIDQMDKGLNLTKKANAELSTPIVTKTPKPLSQPIDNIPAVAKQVTANQKTVASKTVQDTTTPQKVKQQVSQPKSNKKGQSFEPIIATNRLLPQGELPVVTPSKAKQIFKKTGRTNPFETTLKSKNDTFKLPENSSLLDTEKVRAEVTANLKNKADSLERTVYGDATSDITGGTKTANGYVKEIRAIKEGYNKGIEKGMSSEVGLVRNVSRGIRTLFGSAGDTAERISKKGAMRGGIDESISLANDFKKLGDTMLPDKVSQERVWAVLDPELSGKKISEVDLSPQEIKALNTVRQASDLINDTNFSMGKISHETWLKGRDGKYLTRAYEEFDVPTELKDSQAFKAGKGKIETGGYMQRKDVDAWKQENAIKDPFYLASKRIQSTNTNKAITDYSNWVNKNSDMVSDTPRKGYTQLSDSPMWGELSGKSVRHDVLTDMKGFYSDSKALQGIYDGINAYDKFKPRQILKASKTVLNPATRLGNQTSDRVFAAMNGVNLAKFEWNMHKFAPQELANNGKYARMLRKEGILGTDMTKYELAKTLVKDGVEQSKVSQVLDKIKSSYGAADDKAKLSAFKYWLDKGKTVDEAIIKVRNGFQDYSKVGLLYDIAAKTPLIGKPFIRFQSELARIIKNSATENPLALATVVGAIALTGEVSSRLSGETPEDKATREGRFGTPVIPFTQIPLVFQTPIGEVNVARMFGMYETAGADTTNKNLVQRASKYLPFDIPTSKEDVTKMLGNDVLLGGVANQVTDTDFRGKSISDPESTKYQPSTLTDEEKLANRAGAAYHNYQIPFINDVENVGRSVLGLKDQYGRVKTPLQAGSKLTGFKVEQFGAKEAQAQREKDAVYADYDKKDAQKQINAVIKDQAEGKIDAVTAQKRIDGLNNKTGATQSNIKQSGKIFNNPNGGFSYLDSNGSLQTAKTEELANKEITKMDFDKSGSNFLEKDGYVYRRNSDGSVATPITKDEYDYKVGSATLTRQKRNDDVNGWIKTANSQLDSIERQLNDPSVDELDKLNLEDDAQVLIDSIQKYTEYGGFTKPKSGSSKSANIAKILAANKNISDTTASTMKKLNALLLSSAPTKPTIRKATLKAITVRGAKS